MKQLVILPVKQVYLGAVKNCNSGCVTVVNDMQVWVKQGRENSFIEEDGKLGEAVVNKRPIGGNWEFEV